MNTEGNFKILIYNDNHALSGILQYSLERRGYRVLIADCMEEMNRLIKQESPVLVIIRRFMSHMDCLTLCKNIRQWSSVPIVIFSENGDVTDMVQCLDAGADDYIEKKVSPLELIARINTVIRRYQRQTKLKDASFHNGELTIDYSRYRVTVGSKEVKLTGIEYKLICYLAYNVGRILTPNQILSTIWGENHSSDLHLLQVNINRLRQKLANYAGDSRYIITKSGIGYMMKNSRL